MDRGRIVDRASRLKRFAPGLAALAGYDRRWLLKDVVSGISVAAIALPVGLAYAYLAGVPAIIGVYSAIFPLFAYALFGSSRQLIVGPDAATCLLVAASLAPLAGGDPERYLTLLPVLTLMTGLLYLIAGVARLGFIAAFLSQPILTGYLNGIALIILVGQLPKLLGYPSDEFVLQLHELVEHLGVSHLPTALLGLGVLAGLLILDLRALGVAVTGELPSGLPVPHLGALEAAAYRSLFHNAAAIMLISFASGMLTAKSFARRNHYEIDANQELIAFGASNLASGLAQGFSVTGADSRTAVNNAVGGKSQLVSIIAAATMLCLAVSGSAACPGADGRLGRRGVRLGDQPVRRQGAARSHPDELARGPALARHDARRAGAGRPARRHARDRAVARLAAHGRIAAKRRRARARA